LEIVTVTATSAGAQRSSSEPLWRALAVFRFASVGYAALRLAFIDGAEYERLDWAWVAIAAMAAWTAGTTVAYARPDRRSRLLLGADLAVTVGLLLSTAVLQYPSASAHGALPVTATWMAGPVVAWAVRYGRRGGAAVALVIACCDFVLERDGLSRIRYLAREADIRAGDRVYSSGYGGIYPEGLFIGTVLEVYGDPLTQTPAAYIEPGVNFNQLRDVMIILEFNFIFD